MKTNKAVRAYQRVVSFALVAVGWSMRCKQFAQRRASKTKTIFQKLFVSPYLGTIKRFAVCRVQDAQIVPKQCRMNVIAASYDITVHRRHKVEMTSFKGDAT